MSSEWDNQVAHERRKRLLSPAGRMATAAERTGLEKRQAVELANNAAVAFAELDEPELTACAERLVEHRVEHFGLVAAEQLPDELVRAWHRAHAEPSAWRFVCITCAVVGWSSYPDAWDGAGSMLPAGKRGVECERCATRQPGLFD